MTRSPAVLAVINGYNFVLASLDEISNELDGETAATAGTLLNVFLKKNTLLALHIASPILKQLENLNGSLQGREKTVSGMLRSVSAITDRFTVLRSETEFAKIVKHMDDHYDNLCKKCDDEKYNIELDPLSLPRKRFMKDYTAHHPKTAEDHFRQIYYRMLDSAISQLKDRFDQTDLKCYAKLEELMISENTAKEDVPKYPDIDYKELSLEITFLRRHAKNLKHKELSNVNILGEFLSKLDKATQDLYPNVRALTKLLLTSPVSTCESERSFSSLRRLKTQLISTMGQVRLNVPYPSKLT